MRVDGGGSMPFVSTGDVLRREARDLLITYAVMPGAMSSGPLLGGRELRASHSKSGQRLNEAPRAGVASQRPSE